VAQCVIRFLEYTGVIAPLFQHRGRDVSPHAKHYLQGLLSHIAHKNMLRMSDANPHAKQEDLQHFLSDSPWSQAAVWRWIAQRASQRLGGHPQSMLILDESAFAKKGEKSVGVARQYNGRLGKTDNCQVGVYSVLSLHQRATLVGARLFLPESWVKDSARCLEAGVPKEEIRPRTKIQLAQELVAEALENQVQFAWVGMDAFYGRDQGFLQWVETQGKKFMADVPCDTLVWAERPPAGQRPAQAKPAGRSVEALWKQWKVGDAGTPLTLRIGENGPVAVRVWARRVWVWPKKRAQAWALWLLVQESADGRVKYSLSNAPAEAGLQELGVQQGERHFIEQAFEDGKSELGMGEYEARKWRAWQHHMALVGLAMLFVTEERLDHSDEAPLLSTRDVVELIDWYFKSPRTEAEVEAAMLQRHRRRAKMAANALARAKRAAKLPPKIIPK
jgi:SRSO17 transposase